MKMGMKKWMALVVLGAMALPAVAQERPDDGPPPPRREDGNGNDRPNPPSPRDDRPGGRRQENQPPPPRPAGPVGEASSPQVRAMMGYIQLVDEYKRLTQDPTAAGVAAVVTAGDLLRVRGAKEAIEYFEKTLPTVKNSSIRNAIRLQLADFYRASGNVDKALEQLSALMTTDVVAGTFPPTAKKAE